MKIFGLIALVFLGLWFGIFLTELKYEDYLPKNKPKEELFIDTLEVIGLPKNHLDRREVYLVRIQKHLYLASPQSHNCYSYEHSPECDICDK